MAKHDCGQVDNDLWRVIDLHVLSMSRVAALLALLCSSVATLGAADELGYSPDGGLVSFGEFDYVYD